MNLKEEWLLSSRKPKEDEDDDAPANPGGQNFN